MRLNGNTYRRVRRGGNLVKRNIGTNLPLATFRIQPVRTKRNRPSTCHSDRNEMEWRNLPKRQALPYAGYYCNLRRFLHSADAAVGMTYRRVLPFIHTGYICYVHGTAHSPFPTVSLKGPLFQPEYSKNQRRSPHSPDSQIAEAQLFEI